MDVPVKFFLYHEIHDAESVPNQPGLYAWYYRPFLTKKDIESLGRSLDVVSDTEPRKAKVQQFFEKHLFAPYREPPYTATLRAPLRPTYEGQVIAHHPVSPGLVGRTEKDPQRLLAVKQVIERSLPWFASPVYIGMATRLRERLWQHVRAIDALMEGLHAGGPLSDSTLASSEASSEDEQIAHSFARDVVIDRQFDVNRLCVFTLPLDKDLEFVRNDVENILNRINFPLCGRN